MDDRQRFLKIFSQIAGPVLQEDGFNGSGQTFRRILGPVVHVLYIQGSRHGGKCCVCLGIHLDCLLTVDGKKPDLAKIDEVSCEFRTRLNYGELDTWWSYGTNEQEAEESVKAIIKTYADVGKGYFLRFSKFPEDFTRLTPEAFDSRTIDVYPQTMTKVRALLSLARIYLHLGNLAFSKNFAERGLLLSDKAVGLKHQFSEIIKAANLLSR